MDDGLLCAGTRQGPALSLTERSLPSSRRWLEEASGFLSLIPKGRRKANPSKEQANVPFVPEENAWDSVDETCAQGRAPPRPPRAPGAGGGLAPFPPSLGPGQQIGSRLQSQGQDPSDSPPALPWRVLPEHSTSLTSAATRDPPAARAPGAASRASHLPPRPAPLL